MENIFQIRLEWRRFDEDDSKGVLRKTIPKGPRTQIIGL